MEPKKRNEIDWEKAAAALTENAEVVSQAIGAPSVVILVGSRHKEEPLLMGLHLRGKDGDGQLVELLERALTFARARLIGEELTGGRVAIMDKAGKVIKSVKE